MENYFSLINSRGTAPDATFLVPAALPAPAIDTAANLFEEQHFDMPGTRAGDLADGQVTTLAPISNSFSNEKIGDSILEDDMPHVETYFTKYVDRSLFIQETENRVTHTVDMHHDAFDENITTNTGHIITNAMNQADSDRADDINPDKKIRDRNTSLFSPKKENPSSKPDMRQLLPQAISNKKDKASTEKTSPSKNRLVIGKIVVEILPSKPPVTRVITMQAPPAPSTNSSKINRLSFGLGRL